MVRKSKEEWKVFGNVFDNFTINTIYKLMSQKVIEGLESPVKIGKEANIFTARTKDGGQRIVKVYRLESINFKKMYHYIKSDPRFIDIKKQRRQVVFSWVRREYRNLLAARKAGIRVPIPFTCLNNVLVLEYIGDKEPAEQIKDHLPEDTERFFNEVINYARLLYQKAKLVHADLSEYNILNYQDNPVFIDFSQGTSIEDMQAGEYLERDAKNLARFFRKAGLDVSREEIFNQIKYGQ